MLLAQRLNVKKLTNGKARSFFQVSLFPAKAEDIQYIVKRRSGLAHIVINERISDGKKHRQILPPSSAVKKKVYSIDT
jgi:hypothetical protein